MKTWNRLVVVNLENDSKTNPFHFSSIPKKRKETIPTVYNKKENDHNLKINNEKNKIKTRENEI